MKPGSESRRNEALSKLTSQWAQAPRGIRSVTLIALSDRGLAECRPTPGSVLAMYSSYTSSSWQWRLKGVPTDTARLDKLASLGTPGLKWIARQSTTGRGYRLHQSSMGKWDTPREAIDNAT